MVPLFIYLRRNIVSLYNALEINLWKDIHKKTSSITTIDVNQTIVCVCLKYFERPIFV